MAKPIAYSEVDAMRDVDAALNKLAPDAQQRVMDWAFSKHSIRLRSNAGASAGAFQSPVLPVPQAKDIKSFLVHKNPENFYERVACLVFWLEKFDSRTEVGTKDITQANSDARLSKLTNPAVFVKHAIHTYGYLTSLGKRKFALSARGEAVVEALPDRTKIAEVHEKFRFGKRASKKTKSQK